MDKYIIRYENDDVIDVLKYSCLITYKSPNDNIAFIKTGKTKEDLLNIEGVLKVEKSRVGKAFI